MIGERELKTMKPTAILVNTARGPIINYSSLIKALENGWIAGAGIDGYDEEPLQPNHPITRFKNVVLSPHAGSATHETRTKMAKLVAENLTVFYKGKVPPTLVNKEVIKVRPPGFEKPTA